MEAKSNIDTSQANKIMQNFKNNQNITNLVGKTTLKEYFEEIYNAQYIISNDSSAQHIAHTFKIPCTVIWGRWQNSQIVKAYSCQSKQTLNIFNSPYCFNGKKDEKGINRNLITFNLNAIPAQTHYQLNRNNI